MLVRKQRVKKQLLTFNKEEIVFQLWIAGFRVSVTLDSWPNPLVLSGIKSNPEIYQISISNYFLAKHFCHLGKLPRDLLPLINLDWVYLSLKQVTLGNGNALFSLNITVSSSDTQVLLRSLQYWLTLSSETWPQYGRPDIIP